MPDSETRLAQMIENRDHFATLHSLAQKKIQTLEAELKDKNEGLMKMRAYLWDRDTRLMAQDGSVRDTHEGCEQALSDLWEIIDPLTKSLRAKR